MAAHHQEPHHPWGWSALHHPNPLPEGVERRNRMIKNIDHGPLVKRLWFVGASGFFATSYAFFASNVTKPLINFTFPPCGRLGSNASIVMDELTLTGAAVGMLAAGILADLYGRKKLYGFELALLIVSTLGIMQSSEGLRTQRPDGTARHSMDMYTWLSWWRFWLGIAIGAEHPLVAVITAEWVRNKSRGRMLAMIFAMQPLARLMAYGVGLAALTGVSWANGMSPDAPDEGDRWKHVADQVWRLVTGIGIIPGVIAIGFRFTIPETPRYYADILMDTVKGLKRTGGLYHDRPGDSPLPLNDISADPSPVFVDDAASSFQKWWTRCRTWWTGVYHVLRTRKAGQNLGLLSALWIMTDISWYCLSLESPSAMATLFFDASATASSSALNTGALCPEFLSWSADANDSSTSIYRELERSATRFMLVVSIGSVLGCGVLIVIINRVHRKVLLMATCSGLAMLFAISGTVLLAMPIPARSTPASRIAIDVLFGLMHFLFTLGPRTLVLIMAVELFPTMYRGTFYGTAAAVGKIGAIVIRPIIGKTAKLDMSLGARLMVAVVLMVGCVVISNYLPEVQRARETTGNNAVNGNGGGVIKRTQAWVDSHFPKHETLTLDELEIMALQKTKKAPADEEIPMPQLSVPA